MAAQTKIGSTYNMLALPFQATNIANGNGTLATVQADSIEYVAPANGSVIGFSAGLNAALSTGTLEFYPTVNGSLMPSFANALVYNNQQRASQQFEARRDNYTFVAGQRIGVEWRKSGTISPTTTDGTFLLLVLLEDVNY